MSMSADGFPTHAEQIDAAWLTQALRQSGALREARVTTVDARPVGNGLLGESIRFGLQYDRPEAGAPEAVVAKFGSRNESSRAMAAATKIYLREIRFYEEIAPHIRTRTPRTHFTAISDDHVDFLLLMEDLSPARGGNQLDGCSVDDCRVAVQEIAALHAAHWGDPTLQDRVWLQGREPVIARQEQMLPGIAQAFRERYDGLLSPEALVVLARFVPLYGQIARDRQSPQTLVHGDFRLDNVLFDVHGRTGTMATLDWQTTHIGAALFDVAFFIGGSLPLAERRAHEEALVRHYLEVLQAAGVKDYGWDACWRDYRRFACRSLFTAVTASMGVGRTERGDRMFMKMMQDHCQQLIDLDAFSLWQ